MTFHGPTWYAHGCLLKASRTLATGPGNVRTRLLDAYSEFGHLTEGHFPEHLRADFRWIMARLGKHPARISEDRKVLRSSAEESLRHMQNRTGVEIAGRLLNLLNALDTYTREGAKVAK